MGKYPVIFLSLKGVEGSSFDDARYMITELIGKEAERFRFWSVVRHFLKTIRIGIGLSFRSAMEIYDGRAASCIESSESVTVIVYTLWKEDYYPYRRV